ncbi:glutamate--tRNA ligase family protein [Algoriphagus sp.]|uniref:glutamate--tRNA ligase family protein n=1 Tax=Algoriphagus sp. TaxID=1872435 RepID=UPI003F6ED215
MDFKLTRLAPTPSGFLHLGNLYSFLVTKALAEKSGAKVLLRIDDLDRERYRPEYVQDIFDTLDFMEIGYDLGPKSIVEFEQEWSQIHRMGEYSQALDTIKEKKLLFACGCSRKKIQQMNPEGYYLGHCQTRNIPLERNDTCWRMDTFAGEFIQVNTYTEGKKAYVLPEESAFFMVRKKDKLPAYQLTSIIDDMYYGVDLIVRGQDLLGSTLAQHFLADELGLHSFQDASFYHHPLLKAEKNKKLSKSEGATSIQFLRKEEKKVTDIYGIMGKMLGASEEVKDFDSFKKHLDL